MNQHPPDPADAVNAQMGNTAEDLTANLMTATQPAHSSTYPVSRLAPAFHAPDLTEQVGRVEAMLSARTSAKLGLIADQIRHLQDSARAILKQAEDEQNLHQADCGFERKPGHIYHLYCKQDGSRFWSMLSPADWRGQPPHAFTGSYRLEGDYSWTRLTDPAAAT
ncbi:Protein of unknown function (DUF2452) [Thiorhodovibrio frisius]|uniref:DUF2452 domain-containing protein n=2 Tax=Thiorhodovibrio frisius TaxID=631362 RepID=H8Z4K3_9GAMM|nr:Protein of unknown function (DUF2452) [Thiorhodovibrio frisius]WPL20997.1 hypothetical protein Thiofri_01104 [Thiorhodovibrio frisius]